MKKIDSFTFFWKDKIGQWNMTPFKDNEGTEYNCAEQYMFARKAKLFNDFESLEKIMKSSSPREQQKLGREVKNFEQKIWDANKVGIVTLGNIFKFSQNKNLKEILLSTKGTILVEASPYDKIWGIGLGVEDKNITNMKKWKGENLLGFILTNVRDFYL